METNNQSEPEELTLEERRAFSREIKEKFNALSESNYAVFNLRKLVTAVSSKNLPREEVEAIRAAVDTILKCGCLEFTGGSAEPLVTSEQSNRDIMKKIQEAA